MRVWKNKKGVIAYLVLPVGLLMLGGPVLWAKNDGGTEAVRVESDDLPKPSPMMNGNQAPSMPPPFGGKDGLPQAPDAPPSLLKPPMNSGENGPPGMPPKLDGNKMLPPPGGDQMPAPPNFNGNTMTPPNFNGNTMPPPPNANGNRMPPPPNANGNRMMPPPAGDRVRS